jgi:hypothetical protein
MQARLNDVAEAMEQRKSEEQKLLSHDDGNNWYGNDPVLRLIHTLDKMEIRHAYMRQHNLSNKCIVANNMKSVEKKEEPVWQKMANMWTYEKFAPTTMALLPKLSMQFMDSWVIMFDSCSDLSAMTPDKWANRFSP